MPGFEDQNLDPDQFNPEQPGGPAISPENYNDLQDYGEELGGNLSMRTAGDKMPSRKQAASTIKKAAGKTVGEGIADATTVGTGGIGAVLRPVIKWVTEKFVNKLLSKDWWKIILKLYWPQIATFVVLIMFITISLTIIIRAYKGYWGRGEAEAASVYDASVMGDVRVVLGEQIMVSNNPQNNYFSQGDPNFNKEPLNGSWRRNDPYLKNAGCGITSCAMMIRYYGVTNVDPVQFANEMASGGSLNLRPDWMLHYVNPLLKSQGKKERSIAHIAANAETIAKYVKNGDPVLAHGNPICGSEGEHYVLIIGISKDYSNYVISDPAAGKPRQSAARYCSHSQLHSGLKELIVLQ